MKYLKLSEISILTLGDNQIEPENILAITNFSNGNAVVENLFKKYIREASKEVLEGFVKFATGFSFLFQKY